MTLYTAHSTHRQSLGSPPPASSNRPPTRPRPPDPSRLATAPARKTPSYPESMSRPPIASLAKPNPQTISRVERITHTPAVPRFFSFRAWRWDINPVGAFICAPSIRSSLLRSCHLTSCRVLHLPSCRRPAISPILPLTLTPLPFSLSRYRRTVLAPFVLMTRRDS